AGRDRKVSVNDLTPEDQAGLEGDAATRRATLNRLLFPGPTAAFEQQREQYGDLSVVDTVDYLYGLKPGVEHVVRMGPGVDLLLGLGASGEADGKGMRTVMTTINGQLRPVFVRDRSIQVETKAAEKADPSVAGQVAAPFSGVVS